MERRDFKEVIYPNQQRGSSWFYYRVGHVNANVSDILEGRNKLSDILREFSLEIGEKVPYHFDAFGIQTFSIPYNGYDSSSDDYNDGFDAFGHGFTYFPTVNQGVFVELYNDAKYYVGLKYQEKYIAFIGFKIIGNDRVMVTQIQGARFVKKDETKHEKIPHNNYLKGLKWRQLIIHLLERKLSELGFSGIITIQSAYNNGWGNISGHGNTGEKGYNAYDQIALDMGYKGEPSINYRKEI